MSLIQLPQDDDSKDEEIMVSLRKKELEAFVIRIFDGRIGPVIEQRISRMGKENLELAQEKLLAGFMHNSGAGIGSSESRTLQLKFIDKVSLPVFTNRQIKGEGLNPLRVALIDGINKEFVESGPEASIKVEIVVVEGDIDSDNWTPEEFHNKIVREKEGKKSLLTGNVYLNLEHGVGYVRNISFTHNANWMKVCELRLGAKVVDFLSGTKVREAITESFAVKDDRLNYANKRTPPSLNDEVWRLKGIGKCGAFHKRLHSENINTVKDLLNRWFINPQSLQNILGTAKRCEAIVEHARTCKPDKSLQLYFNAGSERRSGVVFNVVGQVMGLVSEGRYHPIDVLSRDQQANANKLDVSALGPMEAVESFDDETCMLSYLQLLNGAYPSNSPRLESPSHYRCETSHTRYGHDYTQPNTSSHYNQLVPFDLSNAAGPSNIPSTDSTYILPFGPSCDGWQYIEDENPINESLIYPGNLFNPSICNTESMSQSFGDQSQRLQVSDTDHSFQYQYSNSGPQDLNSILGAFLSRHACRSRRRWLMLFPVLMLSAGKKRASSEAELASKRPRIY